MFYEKAVQFCEEIRIILAKKDNVRNRWTVWDICELRTWKFERMPKHAVKCSQLYTEDHEANICDLNFIKSSDDRTHVQTRAAISKATCIEYFYNNPIRYFLP